jgi:hypothetical protein
MELGSADSYPEDGASIYHGKLGDIAHIHRAESRMRVNGTIW